MAAASPRTKKQVIDKGIAFVHASFNNTLITITKMNGDKIDQFSAAAAGFGGSRKATGFAAEEAANALGQRVVAAYGMRQIEVRIKGPGAGRDSAIRGLHNSGLKVTKVVDRTPVPHNGCKPKKKRRV